MKIDLAISTLAFICLLLISFILYSTLVPVYNECRETCDKFNMSYYSNNGGCICIDKCAEPSQNGQTLYFSCEENNTLNIPNLTKEINLDTIYENQTGMGIR